MSETYSSVLAEAGLSTPTLRARGFAMPAEWSRHAGTWFSWPHNPDTWLHHLEAAEEALAEAVRWLSGGEIVHINVLDEHHAERVRRILNRAGASGPVRLHLFPTNDAWCRDHGAVFVTHPRDRSRLALNWRFNAWGGKYPPFDLDDAIPARMADALGVPALDIGFVLEGGSIEVNGDGLLLTTSQCLLNPNRNPGFEQAGIEWVLRESLGVQEIVWLEGDLAGDDTDGHIDNLCRFVDPQTLLTVVQEDPDAPDYAALEHNLETLHGLAASHPAPLRVDTLPMPAPYFIDGRRMPASYANFYIGNDVVLLPVYDDPNDAAAHEILQRYFPDRRVVDIDCRSIIWGLGAIHCLSQQVPAV